MKSRALCIARIAHRISLKNRMWEQIIMKAYSILELLPMFPATVSLLLCRSITDLWRLVWGTNLQLGCTETDQADTRSPFIKDLHYVLGDKRSLKRDGWWYPQVVWDFVLFREEQKGGRHAWEVRWKIGRPWIQLKGTCLLSLMFWVTAGGRGHMSRTIFGYLWYLCIELD